MGLGAVVRHRAALYLARQRSVAWSGSGSRGLASGHDHPAKAGDGSARGVHAKDYHDPSELTNKPVDMDYVPGSESYAFDNPWPKLNKGRLDWLFGDGWRRPPMKEEGQFLRANWIPFGFNVYDEYDDWQKTHWLSVMIGTTLFVTVIAINWLMKDDLYGLPPQPHPPLLPHASPSLASSPVNREWSRREAFLEIERRRNAGLPIISKDYVNPARIKIRSEEELANFDIII